MLYHIIYEWLYLNLLAQASESYFVKALNVFQYVTFRTAYASVTSLLISLLFGKKVIAKLKSMKVGQQIREEIMEMHGSKKDTPTMGGVLVIGSVLISSLLWARLNNVYVWIAIVATFLFSVIGFFDDYAKIKKQQSLGLTGRQKLIGQFAIGVGVWAALYLANYLDPSDAYSWNIALPFFKESATLTNLTYIGPFLYLIFIMLVLTFTSNAVNLTDGMDGLAAGVSFITTATLTAFTYLSGHAGLANYLGLTHQPEIAELTVFCGALAGASLGFLWYNAPPADVFMGDTGSLAIGGAIGTIGILTKQEFILLLVGGVFVVEALSVMLQVSFFKITKDPKTGVGKRLFKMTPLHHHFQMKDWAESKVVFRFLIIAALFALLSLSTLKLR